MTKVSPPRSKSALLGGGCDWVVVGFSVRSLAEAASQLGIRVVAVDHFADHDCQHHADSCLRLPYWGKNGQLADGQPGGEERHPFAWMQQIEESVGHNAMVLLGGGTENWPECVQRLHERFTVLGPTRDQLSTLRCRTFWHRLALAAGVRFPESRLSPPDGHSLDQGEYWIRKPVSGAGGIGIRRMDATTKTMPATYVQREIVGRALGAQCMLFESSSTLLGMTESLTAADWPGPAEFIYRGSWGPVGVALEQEARILAICETVRAQTGLRGWLQIDLIEDEKGQLWLLELNPRWAAGMEVLFLSGINPVRTHLQSWQSELPTPASAEAAATASKQVAAKAVVYAERDTELTASLVAALHAIPATDVADVPAKWMVGETIRAGHPLLTVRSTIAGGECSSSLRSRVLQRLSELRQSLPAGIGES